jgi:predicted outer membrane repeat protein
VFISEGDTFDSNLAKSSGGGLYYGHGGYECNQLHSYANESTFISNIAQQGGGFFTRGCNQSVYASSFTENYASGFGGAVMIDSASLAGEQSIYASAIEDNEAGRVGGGVVATGGNVLLSGTSIARNSAADFGGGVFVRKPATWSLRLSIADGSRIADNWSRRGGGLSILSGDDDDASVDEGAELVQLSQTALADNEGFLEGGAVYLNRGSLRSSQCTFDGNHARDGAALFYERGFYRDSASNLTANVASRDGGGCAFASGSTARFALSSTLFARNRALYGAAMSLAQCPLDGVGVGESVRFVSNTAEASGGAIYYGAKSCATSSWCTECSFDENSAAFGNDFSSSATSLRCDWSTPKRITRRTAIEPACALYDAYGEQMTVFEEGAAPVCTARLYGADASDLNVSGVYSATFAADKDGVAQLSFFIADNDAERRKRNVKRSFAITMTVKGAGAGAGADGDLNNVTYSSLSYSVRVWQTPAGTWALSMLLGFLGLFSCAATAILLYLHSAQPIIRGATVPFLWLIVVGCTIMSLFVMLSPLAPQSVSCLAPVWLMHFGFALTIAPIAGKTYRISTIFHTAARAKRVDLATTKLALYFIVAPTAALFVYMTAWTTARANDWQREHWETLDNGDEREYCAYSPAFAATSMVVAVVTLLWLVYLAAGVRNVPRNFNESRWLGTSIYTIAMIFLFVVPLTTIDSVARPIRAVFAALGVFIATEAVLASIFGVKFYLIWKGDADMKKKAALASTASHTTSDWSTSSQAQSTEMSSTAGTASYAQSADSTSAY